MCSLPSFCTSVCILFRYHTNKNVGFNERHLSRITFIKNNMTGVSVEARTAHHSWAHEFTPPPICLGGSCCCNFSFLCSLCSVIVLSFIVWSVLHRFTSSDYPFSIVKPYFIRYAHSQKRVVKNILSVFYIQSNMYTESTPGNLNMCPSWAVSLYIHFICTGNIISTVH